MKNHPDPKYMNTALNHVRLHIHNNEGGPFGACIVCDDTVVSVAHNTVLKDHDSTCHAEINAIREACKKLHSHDLSNCVIYSTSEPCPMCFSAIHWANIRQIIYGTRIEDVQRLGFRELEISNQSMKELGKSDLIITTDFCRSSCQELLEYWQRNSSQQVY